MELLHTVIAFINAYFIRIVFIPLLIILPFNYFLKNKEDIQYALQVIRWFILSYSILASFHFLMAFLFMKNSEPSSAFIERTSGPYWWAYWSMIFCHSVLPLLLIIKRIGSNIYFLLLISLLMNIGWLIEAFLVLLV